MLALNELLNASKHSLNAKLIYNLQLRCFSVSEGSLYRYAIKGASQDSSVKANFLSSSQLVLISRGFQQV